MPGSAILKIERYYVISMEDKYSSDSLLHFATQKPYRNHTVFQRRNKIYQKAFKTIFGSNHSADNGSGSCSYICRGRSKFQQKCLCTDPCPEGIYPWFIPSNKDNSKMYNVKESWES